MNGFQDEAKKKAVREQFDALARDRACWQR